MCEPARFGGLHPIIQEWVQQGRGGVYELTRTVDKQEMLWDFMLLRLAMGAAQLLPGIQLHEARATQCQQGIYQGCCWSGESEESLRIREDRPHLLIAWVERRRTRARTRKFPDHTPVIYRASWCRNVFGRACWVRPINSASPSTEHWRGANGRLDEQRKE